jgi:Zn-dependent oligopeptidase
MESERAKRAEAERRAAELARLVENGEQDTWEDVVEKTQELRELLGPTNQQVSFEQSSQRRRAGNGGSNRQRSNDGDSR